MSLELDAASSALDIAVHFQEEANEIKLDDELSIALNTSVGETNQMLIPYQRGWKNSLYRVEPTSGNTMDGKCKNFQY